MKTIKKCIAYVLLSAFIIQFTGSGSLTCEAANGYFVSGKLYCHKIAKNKVEVCGIKKAKGTLMIPEQVSYKGKEYKVTQIADMKKNYNSRYHSTIEESAELLREPDDTGYPGYYYSNKIGKYVKDGKILNISESEITKVVLPKTLTYIGEGAFNGCGKLKKVVFAKNCKKLVIGKYAFGGTALKSLVFPEGTCELQDFAAGETSNLTIPSSVKKIGVGVVNCYTQNVKINKKNKKFKMKAGILYTYDEKTLLGASAKAGGRVSVSANTVKLADQAFFRSKVSQIEFLGKIRKIPNGAFAFCGNLTQVAGTDQVAEIGYSAFRGCKNLTDVGKLSEVKEIKGGAFVESPGVSLAVSSGIKIADRAFSDSKVCSRIHVSVPENDPMYSIENGFLIRTDGTEKTVLMQMQDMEKIEIPEGVTKLAVAIGDDELCREVVLPKSLNCQESWIYVNSGTVTYQAEEVPAFRKRFFIWNRQRSGDAAVIKVPGNLLEAYRKSMQEAALESESEWLDSESFLYMCNLEMQEL